METQRGFVSVQEHREETLIYDVEVSISNAMTKSKNADEIWCSEGSFETHWGFLSVKEHREETYIYDVEVVKSNLMTKSKKQQ